MNNDIMICKMAPVELSTSIQPACLPFGRGVDFPQVDLPSFAVGWYLKERLV
jgi:hypothetical protein